MKLFYLSTFLFISISSQSDQQFYEPAQDLESQPSSEEISRDYADNPQTSYANLEEQETEKIEDSYETAVSIENEADQSYETTTTNSDDPQPQLEAEFPMESKPELDLTPTEPTEQPSIEQLTTLINELEEKINENESTQTVNTEFVSEESITPETRSEENIATDSNEINIDESPENVEIDENSFTAAPEQPAERLPLAAEPEGQTVDMDLMKKMMAMMTPEQLAKLNMPVDQSAEKSAEQPAEQPAEQQLPAVPETSSFLSSLNPFSQSHSSASPEISQEKHIFDPSQEQAPVSAFDQTFQDFQSNQADQPLPENPPPIDAFNQGYNSQQQYGQLPHETYGQSQQQFAAPVYQQPQIQQQQVHQEPYQQHYSMQQPQAVSSPGLIENQNTNLIENYQNLPLPPAPIQMEVGESQQQPISSFPQQPSFSQPEQRQEPYSQQFTSLDSNSDIPANTDVPNFASNPYSQPENLSFQQNNPPSPITSDFSYPQRMPDQINEPLPEQTSMSIPDFNELRQEATIEEKLGQISDSLPYNVNLSETPRRPLEPISSENNADTYVQNTETFQNQQSQYENQPSQYENQPSQYGNQYENEPDQYDATPSQYDNQPVNDDYNSYQAGAREEDIASYDQKLELETPTESQVGSFKPPDMAPRFISKDVYESEYFEDDISSHSWLVFIFLSCLCVLAFVGLMRRKFRKLGLAAAKGGRRIDRGATEGGFDAVYKPLNDDDMA